MITKEDITLLVTYFQSLQEVPEALTNTVLKLGYIDEINKNQDLLVNLSNGGE